MNVATEAVNVPQASSADTAANAQNLADDLHWLEQVLQARMRSSFGGRQSLREMQSNTPRALDLASLPPPTPVAQGSNYAGLLHNLRLEMPNRLLLALSLAPHIQPSLLDQYMLGEYAASASQEGGAGRLMHDVGGVSTSAYRGFIPTGLTWVFLMAGRDVRQRLATINWLQANNGLFAEQVLSFAEVQPYDPFLSGALIVHPEWLAHLLS